MQTYYETELLRTSTPSAISWIGSIQAFLLLMIGMLTGPVYDAGYFRTLLVTGSFLVTFGTMMLSLCKEFWQVLLAQAFCVGLGMGCLFVPSVAILSQYFTTRIAFSVGLSAAGSGLGGIIYPIMFHKLQPNVGFPWAIRIWGFVILFGLSIPVLVMRMRAFPSQKRPMLDLPAFKSMPYTLFVIGCFFGFMGMYAPYFYVQLFAIHYDIVRPSLVFYLVPILNSTSIIGRIIPNFIADYTGSFNIIAPCAMITGILTLCLIPIRSTAALIVFCLLYGFFTGSLVSLPPSVLIGLSPNKGLIGTHMGMAFGVTACGLLIGTPIAGVILDAKGFAHVWIFGGVLTLAGGVIMWIARCQKVGWSVLKKA
jgi:MFS family permease